jgi:hypothetical protein
MECVSAGQAANVVIIFQCVNADCAGIARGAHALRGEGGIDMLVLFLFVVV